MIWLLTISIALFIVFNIAAMILIDECIIFEYYFKFILFAFVTLVLLAISYGIAGEIICDTSNGDSKYCVEENKND